MGDLLFVNCHPYLASGSPEQWKQSLAEIKGSGVQVVVPGHGPVGRSKSLSMMLQYIQSLENIVANMIKCGKSVKQASFEPVPSLFDTWLSPDNFFITNLEFLYNLQHKRRKQNKLRARSQTHEHKPYHSTHNHQSDDPNMDSIRLIQYTHAIRRKYLKILGELPWDEVVKDRGASFPSIRDIFLHALDAEDLFINHIVQAKWKMGSTRLWKIPKCTSD